MYQKIFTLAVMWAILTVVLLALAGCTIHRPASALYYPLTQEQIDKRVAEDKAWEEFNFWATLSTGFKK